MARSTIAASPAPPPRNSKPETQAAASAALAALFARRRGLKAPKMHRLKQRKSKPDVESVEGQKDERERGLLIERNVRVLKKSGKVGEGEKEVRRRILQMREEARGVKGKQGKAKMVDEDDYDSDD